MTETTPRTGSPKKILVVAAHPEPRSLNAALTRFAMDELRAAGHEVQVSDLYAMKWKAALDADDYPGHAPDERLDVQTVSQRATLDGRLSADIAAEQEKVSWSDAVILQFPLWWFSVPAILKGWIDRVFTAGYAHGPALPPPYTEGALGGRRALVSVTTGGHAASFGERGVHGHLEDILFPVQHGLFWYTGMTPLEPFGVHGTMGLSDEAFGEATRAYKRRLDGLFTDEPVRFRRLDADYDREKVLREGAEAPGTSGLALHRRPGA
ncbi:NAD(P)H-dependent oxidoreductase [Streptomyces sp. RFCAC02]|uniref:NAD(P)H-dependent oxidoreductase n=1 Tax=Streptomyces sp. RFCAC02 TaxID=2499143 RepID=UPI0010216987|nr:NAD(P)H-dependent oxidoreductase [Streptomyces sp. RFCAC02]